MPAETADVVDRFFADERLTREAYTKFEEGVSMDSETMVAWDEMPPLAKALCIKLFRAGRALGVSETLAKAPQ
jgi:hypothetical protein